MLEVEFWVVEIDIEVICGVVIFNLLDICLNY